MSNKIALQMSGISKRFVGVQALDKVDLTVNEAEIHALLGENGAGKSTLMKILSGAYTRDEGVIQLFGSPVEIQNPKHAETLGISIIYQELNLIPHLTVAENIFLGRHKMKNKLHIDWKRIHDEAGKLLRDLEVDLDPQTKVGTLGIARQQMVEVAKALSLSAKIIIMDEPTAPLTDRETDNLFKMVRKLKANGVTVIYISHRLEEIIALCDQATIMRDGKTIIKVPVHETSIDEIIKYMVGRELKEKFPRVTKSIGEEVFSVTSLTSEKIRDVSFSVKEGEILGFGGLVGSGRTETARAIFGLDKKLSGTIRIRDKQLEIKTPKDAISAGIGFVTEDRKAEGLVLSMNVRENVSLASLKQLSKGIQLMLRKERDIAEDYVDKLNIKTPTIEQLSRNLSGGNQQKVVLAKWLMSKSDVLIFDEPTRGIDVGAKIEVYNIINTLAKAGRAIIVISSEIPELLGICDRILVMARGKKTGELSINEATQEKIMTLATDSEKHVKGWAQ
ncbi:sugar ABC transporter ATP-binding protein [Pleomorphochaeta sp. DL1XJH-081]|uniref:sugar ABC transporter ATP-binding protein n=1 Tax=Pleomorphochaeta sp. DL1XJH-081 TaxID=3409690 RepID=UPI003BB665F9